MDEQMFSNLFGFEERPIILRHIEICKTVQGKMNPVIRTQRIL